MGSLLPSGDKSEGPLQDASFRHSRRHHSAAALGSATADERVKKEAKMKTISSPSGGYDSITDKMLRFVMVKTSAQVICCLEQAWTPDERENIDVAQLLIHL